MSEVALSVPEVWRRARAAQQAGKLNEAAQLCRTILERNGKHADALQLLGVVECQRGRPEVALRLVDAALAIKPDYVEALIARGNILCALNEAQQALGCYDQALLINPDNPQALYNRGCTLQQLDRLDDALATYDQALAINPKFPEVLNNRGNVLYALKRFREALESYDRALAIRPDNAEALNNRGSVLKALGRSDEALASYDRALAINPSLIEAHYCRGNILHEMNHWQAALASYGRALALKPDHAGAKLAQCMAQLPILYNDEAEIGERRAAYAEHLTALDREFSGNEAAARLASVIGSHLPFYLAYQGYNDRDLQAQYGALVCRAMAARYAPAQLAPLPRPNEPVRLGFVSGYFRGHAATRIQLKGWISQLDRRQFRVFGYHTGFERDDFTKLAVANCERFVQWSDVDRQLATGHPGRRSPRPDLSGNSYRCDICCLGGATAGSGSVRRLGPSPDQRLSDGRLFFDERFDGAAGGAGPLHRATDTVAQLGRLLRSGRDTCGFTQPERTRLASGSQRLLVWAIAVQILPQFDQVFPRIAREAGDCQFVFIELSQRPDITEQFRARLERAFAQWAGAPTTIASFFRAWAFAKYAAVFDQCDVFLDSIGFSGGNTTLESLSHHLPIVTIAGRLMRGRHSTRISSK